MDERREEGLRGGEGPGRRQESPGGTIRGREGHERTWEGTRGLRQDEGGTRQGQWDDCRET